MRGIRRRPMGSPAFRRLAEEHGQPAHDLLRGEVARARGGVGRRATAEKAALLSR